MVIYVCTRNDRAIPYKELCIFCKIEKPTEIIIELYVSVTFCEMLYIYTIQGLCTYMQHSRMLLTSFYWPIKLSKVPHEHMNPSV